MSASNCLRCCLLRPSASAAAAARLRQGMPLAAAVAASFSTTANHSANAKPKPGTRAAERNAPPSIRQGKLFTIKKKKKNDSGARVKSPLPGERKAFRKRILLSNTNALPVPGLTDLGAESMLDPSNVCKVLSLPDDVIDQLRADEAFKTTQCWSMFRKPSMLIRTETVDLITRMHAAAKNNKTLRLVLTGDRVTGKSLMLLQAMTQAHLNDWLVVNIPDAQELTTACTEYAPILDTEPMQYMQQNYVLKLIQAIKKSNEKLLLKLTTVFSHAGLPQNIPIKSPLMQLANSAKEAEGAWAVFQALWQEMTAQGHGRPPMLLSLDGLTHIMRISDYRTPAFNPIHSHDLALVRLFTDHLSGATSLPNGGAVIAATSRNNAPRNPSMELALAQREAEQLGGGKDVPQPQPYLKGYDERVEAVLRNVQVIKLQGLSKLEARALMEYWAASGVLRITVDEKSVTEKWALGGSGIVGEMERASLLTMRF
ncbi:mitochondrial ribosomal death-associated protein 3-domain-containing protein [Lasiosphaeria ovina]|uniref:Small ribosomal subunit protein mS29 n=1 Tax=Lasiosphaeria ovina TaxID=92902 RepID=A0AAE0NL07_9PEZI|nr:mitochondrial ribosomal death-associated protein 3-domain-containing protein [Lasiosphaeria ovina]